MVRIYCSVRSISPYESEVCISPGGAPQVVTEDLRSTVLTQDNPPHRVNGIEQGTPLTFQSQHREGDFHLVLQPCIVNGREIDLGFDSGYE